MHNFIHISPKFTLTYLVSLETLGSPLEFAVKLCGFKHNLAAQHEFVLTDPRAGQWVSEVNDKSTYERMKSLVSRRKKRSSNNIR